MDIKIAERYKVCGTGELDLLLADKDKISRLSEDELRILIDKKLYDLFRLLNLSEEEYATLRAYSTHDFLILYNNLCNQLEEDLDPNSNLAIVEKGVTPNI